MVKTLADIEDDKAAEVFGDTTALFVACQIAEMGHTTVAYLHENLVAPAGWIALGKVWRADFIAITGEYVTITEAGKEFVAFVEAGALITLASPDDTFGTLTFGEPIEEESP